jgi:uncharacterized protein YjbI with pentapeptide repeats
MSETMTATARALTLASLLVAAAEPALAGCSDFAQPGVQWRRCLQDGQALGGVDLTGANIRDASFKRADLGGAILIEVDARRTRFVSASMQGVQLDRARLVRADLTKADLRGASLVGADLTRAMLFRADLSGADLTGARLSDADLHNAILDGATWIDGITICAEGSIGQCNPGKRQGDTSKADPSG